MGDQGAGPGVRRCWANDPTRNVGFCPNVIVTSKYTAASFVPRFLFEQFSRGVNLVRVFVCGLDLAWLHLRSHAGSRFPRHMCTCPHPVVSPLGGQYFLFICVMQCIKAISLTNGIPMQVGRVPGGL